MSGRQNAEGTQNPSEQKRRPETSISMIHITLFEARRRIGSFFSHSAPLDHPAHQIELRHSDPKICGLNAAPNDSIAA
jgi:hypothetical protein